VKQLPVCERCGLNPVGHKRRATCYRCVPRLGDIAKTCERCGVNPVAYATRSTCFDCVPRQRAVMPVCEQCGHNPVAYQDRTTCYDCVPRRRKAPLRCKRCGSKVDYFRAGLCRLCHRMAPVRGSCRDCLSWSVSRKRDWLCEACLGWRKRFPSLQQCPSCQRCVPVNERGYCRLCSRQAHLVRPAHQIIDVVLANVGGQQLFFSDMARNKAPPEASADRPVHPSWPHPFPVPHRQLTLFDVPLDLSVRLERIPEQRVPELAAALDLAAGAHGDAHGWSSLRQASARRSIRILLSVQDTPGARIKTSEVALLQPLRLHAMTLVLDVLRASDMLEDDSEPELEAWFRTQMTDVAEQIQAEVAEWFHALRDGSQITPRTRPRNIGTVRHRVADVKTALVDWSAAGHTSLREITRNDIIGALPPDPVRQRQVADGLRSLFRFLKGRKVVFVNPTTRVKAAPAQLNYPLPMNLQALREAINSDQPARAAMAAIVAFHALRTAEIQNLKLVDVRDGRLLIGERSIVLAQPVRDRVAAWLDERSRRWPQTLNPHLFINKHTALRLTPVSSTWISQTNKIPVQAIREDRILHEALANSGDIRLLTDLFNLTTGGAERYAHTTDQTRRPSS
jgi:site-specific recombinase XerD